MKRIKKYVLNKIAVSTLCLILLLLFSFFPSHENINIEVSENNTKKEKNEVYLLDNDNYVSKVIAYFDKTTIKDNIRNRLELLKNGSIEYDDFYPLIPQSTKILNIDVEKNSVYLNFSKDILTVNKYIEEKMIESIIYTLTEINGINEVYIKVENEPLKELPNSKKKLDYPLTRNYGINKEYNLNSFNDITKTTIYFIKETDENKYYVPVTKIMNSNQEKINIIISELKSIVNSQNNLYSYINNNLELLDYEEKDKTLSLTFNDFIYDNKTISNEVKESLCSSIFDNYNVNEIIFNTEKNKNILNLKR